MQNCYLGHDAMVFPKFSLVVEMNAVFCPSRPKPCRA